MPQHGIMSVLLFFSLSLVPAALQAGAVPARGVGVHISPVQTTNSCSPAGVMALYDFRYQEYTFSTPSGPFYYLYLLGCNQPDSVGLGGMECGIQYPGGYNPSGGDRPICVFSWTKCADLEFPSTGWPASGGGNLITWSSNHCSPEYPGDQNGVFFKVAGYFYMGGYGQSQFKIGPRPVTGKVAVADCSGAEHLIDDPYAVGTAGFGVLGWGGCYGEPLPVEPTTWGRIKSSFGR